MTVEYSDHAIAWLEEDYDRTYDFHGTEVSYWKHGRIKATNWQQPMFECKDMEKDGCNNYEYTILGEQRTLENCHCNNDDVVHNLWRQDWRPGFDMNQEETLAWVRSERSHAHGWHPDRDEVKREQPVPTADVSGVDLSGYTVTIDATAGSWESHWGPEFVRDINAVRTSPRGLGYRVDYDHIDLFTRGIVAPPDFS